MPSPLYTLPYTTVMRSTTTGNLHIISTMAMACRRGSTARSTRSGAGCMLAFMPSSSTSADCWDGASLRQSSQSSTSCGYALLSLALYARRSCMLYCRERSTTAWLLSISPLPRSVPACSMHPLHTSPPASPCTAPCSVLPALWTGEVACAPLLG